MSFDFNPEDAMYEALAEILDVDSSIIELISPNIGEDNGSSKDEWHYGYYFELPRFDDLDEDIQEELKERIDIASFPFGETVYISDGELSETKADPLGWRADYEADEYYQKYILPRERAVEELDLIAEKVKCSDDELIIKALLFSAFSITESYIRSLIWSKIPDFKKGILDENLEEILNRHLSDRLSKTQGRQEIYKQFAGKKLREIPHYVPFRHSLAHDIGSGQVIDGKIIIKDRNDKEHKGDVGLIIAALKRYVLDVS